MGSNNARLSVKGFGSRLAVVTKIDYSIESFSEEGSAARYKAHYPLWMMDTAFTVTFAFASSHERHVFCHWVQDYMERLTTNRLNSGSMHVSVPSRKYSRWGVPVGNLLYGDSVAQSGRVYFVAINFLGAREQIKAKDSSEYKSSRVQASVTDRFTPGGNQRGGKTFDNALFDIIANLTTASSLVDSAIDAIETDSFYDNIDAGTKKSL